MNKMLESMLSIGLGKEGIEWGECGYFRWSDQKELYEEMKFDLRSKG